MITGSFLAAAILLAANCPVPYGDSLQRFLLEMRLRAVRR
jgi:hypothetical protein